MEQSNSPIPMPMKRRPWNKGKLIGPKQPLRSKHVWSIRTKLQLEGRKRDLALFNLAIDSKLRGCDVVSVKVEDVAPNGYAIDRATLRQKKTGHPVRFEITEQTRQALDDYIREAGRKEISFSGVGKAQVGASQPASMRVWFPIGLQAAVWTLASLAHIPCGGLRQP